MKKKIIALLVALGMVTMLFGCGNGAESEGEQDQIANLRNELADLQYDYDALARAHTLLQLENDALHGQVASLQSDVDALLLSIDAHLGEIFALEDEYYLLLAEFFELLDLLDGDIDEDDEDDYDEDDDENDSNDSN